MTTKMRFSRNSLPEAVLDLSLWPTVDTRGFSDERITLFEKRKRAIVELFNGKNVLKICETVGISVTELYRLVERCLRIHPDGRIWGFRALPSYTRFNSYDRKKDIKAQFGKKREGYAGALENLFKKYPTIREVVHTYFFKLKKKGLVHEPRIPIKSIFKRFIDACKEQGLTAAEYPYCTRYRGYRSLGKYLRKLMQEHPRSAVLARYGDEAARKLGDNSDSEPVDPILFPLQRVEFDAHLIDALFNIKVPNVYGGIEELLLERLWILVLLETFSRAVLGYYVSLNSQYSEFDVLICIKRSLEPWSPLQLTIPGLTYPKQGGLPSYVLPQYAWAVLSRLSRKWTIRPLELRVSKHPLVC